MKKITPATTLEQLDFERSRLGITHLAVMAHPAQPYLACFVEIGDGTHATGGGGNLADAIDDAFSRLEARIGVRLVEAAERTS